MSALILKNNITYLRKEHGYSQWKLSKKLGFTSNMVDVWENRSVTPTTGALVKMSKLFNISIDQLVRVHQKHKNNLIK